MGRKPSTKKRVHRVDKKEAILEGLVDFYKSNSLRHSNMDDMAAYLNKSKATIYKYFRSKEDIIDALISMKIKHISGFVLILKDERIPFFDRYKRSFALLAEHIADIPNEFLLDVREQFPPVYQRIESLIDLAVIELKEYYLEGMRLSVFHQLNADLLAHNDFLFFRSLTDPEFLANNHLTMEKAFADFYQIRCHGLLP